MFRQSVYVKITTHTYTLWWKSWGRGVLVVCRPATVENRHFFGARIALGSVRVVFEPRVTVTGGGGESDFGRAYAIFCEALYKTYLINKYSYL